VEKKGASKPWALILGASSGFGGAIAVELAKEGYNILGVHLDRQVTMPNVNAIVKKIEAAGSRAVYFNINAADPIKMDEVLDEIKERNTDNSKIKVLVHSLAFGTLKNFIGDQSDVISRSQMNMTMDVMANSLIYWTQGLYWRGLLAEGGRIFAMSSAGSHSVIPHYGAVSAAKAALESHIRQLAVELGFMKISANTILAGITETPAATKIPGSDKLYESAKLKNPRGRLTTPEDIAKAVASLCSDNCAWISGSVIYVDGGEDIVNYTGEKVMRVV